MVGEEVPQWLRSPTNAPMYQAVLDAAAELQIRRTRIVASMTDGHLPKGVRVVGAGPRLNELMMAEAAGWTQLLSVRHVTTAPNLRVSLPNNRRVMDAGLKMTSLFDWHATTPAARALLAVERPGVYYFTRAPLQVKIVDLREVLMEGPPSEGRQSVLAVRDPRLLDRAMHYWHLLVERAVPAWEHPEERKSFTVRQHQILALLEQDLTDEAIAGVLGISVRTVRYEVASVMAQLGVRSRFSAGVRLGATVEP